MGEPVPPARVLVVESSRTAHELLFEPLRERGQAVLTATDADEALALARRQAPDVVLVDSAAPGALELLDRLRGDDASAGLPVIMLAPAGEPELVLEPLRRGAHDVIVEPFDSAELEARVTAALRVKRLHDDLIEANRRLTSQALTDELTGLGNRRHGIHELRRAVAACVRHGHALAVARVDVDGFEAINDAYGREAGDRVLAEVARRLAGAMRGGDELARWGDGDFVALLPDTDRAGAHRTAERLRGEVVAAPVRWDDHELPVTVCVGWAHWSGDTPDDLLARAERALNEAREAGGGSVRPTGPP